MPFDKEGRPVPGALSHKYTDDLISTTGNGPKNYLQVKHKLPMARELWPEAKIETEMLHYAPITGTEMRTLTRNNGSTYDKLFYLGGIAVFRAKVTLPNGSVGVGHKQETSEDFPDYLEKAETGAIGRALGASGIGVEYSAEDYEYERDPENDKPFKGVVTPGTPADEHAPTMTIGLDLPAQTQRTILMGQIVDAGDDVDKWREIYKAVRYAAEKTKEVDPNSGEILPSTQAWRYELAAAGSPNLAILDAVAKGAHALNANTKEVQTAIEKRRKTLVIEHPLPAMDGEAAEPTREAVAQT